MRALIAIGLLLYAAAISAEGARFIRYQLPEYSEPSSPDKTRINGEDIEYSIKAIYLDLYEDGTELTAHIYVDALDHMNIPPQFLIQSSVAEGYSGFSCIARQINIGIFREGHSQHVVHVLPRDEFEELINATQPEIDCNAKWAELTAFLDAYDKETSEYTH